MLKIASGLEEISTGPYYRWNHGYGSDEVMHCLEYIDEIMEEEGPFDGVRAFRQGAALATASPSYSLASWS